MIAARAAVLSEAGGDPKLTDVEIRDPVDDEVLVRIDAVGICHTDISVAARRPARGLPMVFGHEGAGTVHAVGPRARLQVGQPVVLTFASCGSCGQCGAGRPAYCEHATDLNLRGDGGGPGSAVRDARGPITAGFFGQSSLAGYALARQRNTIAVPDGLDPVLAAPLGCSVQTGVGTVRHALRPAPHEAVAVFGAGAVGLSAVAAAHSAGCRTVVAVDPVPQRRRLAAELGASATVDPGNDDVVAAVVELTGGGAHAALDTTAVPAVLAAALAALRPRGTLAVVGLGAPVAELPVGLIMGRGLTVRGVVEGDSDPPEFIPELAHLVRSGALPVQRLVTTYDFDDFDTAWADAKAGRAVKPVLVTGR